MIHHGDCLDVMAAMEAESVSAVVTDPPYGLGFMGKAWDHGAPGVPFWAEMLRVAKPSAYLLAFGGTRTVHRIATSIEDAGWIIRDMLVWAYASGFPKSKASLKPAWEPIVMARKPGPLAMLNIDNCRIPGQYETRERDTEGGASMFGLGAGGGAFVPTEGRWPANVILTDPIFDGGLEGVVGGGDAGGNGPASGPTWSGPSGSASRSPMAGMGDREPQFYGDTGTYSRFFLIPKADRGEREPMLALGLASPQGPVRSSLDVLGPEHGLAVTAEGQPPASESAFSTVCAICNRQRVNVSGACQCTNPEWVRVSQKPRRNTHPTVKPVDLMRHLVRLVTPAGGTVLDPFLGSGTTGIACEMEGFPWIGIEREVEYVAIAQARLEGVQKGFGLSA